MRWFGYPLPNIDMVGPYYVVHVNSLHSSHSSPMYVELLNSQCCGMTLNLSLILTYHTHVQLFLLLKSF